jgi:hypothetical protein
MRCALRGVSAEATAADQRLRRFADCGEVSDAVGIAVEERITGSAACQRGRQGRPPAPGCSPASIGWVHGLANPQLPAFQNGPSVVELFLTFTRSWRKARKLGSW